MLAPTAKATPVALARLAAVTGANDRTGESVTVHFNPASLQLQLSNELKDTKNNERKQYIAKSSAKLTLDLPFDTTDTGEDVTVTTRKLQAFLIPPMPEGDAARQQIPPPLVLFEWGTLRFKGIAENYKETIDFFSAEGVPLRSTVNLTLSRQDQVFDSASGGPANANVGGSNDDFALSSPPGGPAGAAQSLEAPGAARQIAAANGEESLRFGAGASLSIQAGVTLKPAAAFSAGVSTGGGAGLSLGGGFSGGAGLGLGVGGGAGIGVGVSAGASAGAGLAGAARLSATEGAFAGLRTPSAVVSAKIDPARVRAASVSTPVTVGAGATFQAGGRVAVSGGSGLRANVGAGAKLKFD